ncbi:MAG: ribose-phosphate pyrophosphokinase [Acidobacteria bacterium]|jgi:ribose-phosphate pyrophosphokinase|nr:ribose-phosphate pyrophosphokinase [Acidobacteriota bacterium]
MQNTVLLSGRGNHALAHDVATYLEMELAEIKLTSFSDGENYCQVLENVRGRDVYVIQPTCTPVNDNLMELLLIIDALKRASSQRICAVMPYYGYARQDRKDKPRVPISARLVADMIESAGASRILCIDVHAPQIQGFFTVPVDHLFAAPVFVSHIASQKFANLTIVSPDAGGVERARAYAKRLGASLAIVDKRREMANVAEVMNIIGDVRGRTCCIVDDIIDTAGTLTESVKALMDKGASAVWAAATHAVLSGPAIDRLIASPIEKIFVTDTIPIGDKSTRCPKIEVLSVASLLGEAIKRIHEETSVSSLFV